MRNLKFVCWGVVLLDLVVLHTKARNGFCLMCTKECHMVLTRFKPFWGQSCEMNSHPRRSNKCAALVSLRNADTYITGFTQVKSPMNQCISFTLWQEVLRKRYSTISTHAPVTARNTPVWARSQRIDAVPVQPNTAPNPPQFPGAFDFTKTGFSCAGFACTGKSRTSKY